MSHLAQNAGNKSRSEFFFFFLLFPPESPEKKSNSLGGRTTREAMSVGSSLPKKRLRLAEGVGWLAGGRRRRTRRRDKIVYSVHVSLYTFGAAFYIN